MAGGTCPVTFSLDAGCEYTAGRSGTSSTFRQMDDQYWGFSLGTLRQLLQGTCGQQDSCAAGGPCRKTTLHINPDHRDELRPLAGVDEEVVLHTIEPGTFYDGEWLGAKMHGKGVLVRTDGSNYEGFFVHGKADGKGICMWSSGATYEGQWKKDKAHGYGKYTFPDGSTYEGQWLRDEKCGYGVENHNRDYCYEGQFRANKWEGDGAYVGYNGTVNYRGQFQNGRMDGDGMCNWRVDFDDEEDPVLPFPPEATMSADGQENAFKLKLGDTCSYHGQWQCGKREGNGVFINIRGEVFRGSWVRNLCVSRD